MNINFNNLQTLLGVRGFTFYHSLGKLSLKKPTDAILVETGCARIAHNFLGDGLSTLLLAWYAQQNKSKLYTCDISKENIEECKKIIGSFTDYVEFICGDSVEFLKSFSKEIDYLYLDSMDFITSQDPNAPQDHAVKEYKAAKDRLHSNSVILIDDCYLIHGGKGGKLIPYLLNDGWWIYASFYQTMLIRKETIE